MKTRPDFIWLDVEGGELALLRSTDAKVGPPVLSKVRVLKLETQQVGPNSLDKLEHFLNSEGFSLVLAPALAIFRQNFGIRDPFDAIFVRTQLLTGGKRKNVWCEVGKLTNHQCVPLGNMMSTKWITSILVYCR